MQSVIFESDLKKNIEMDSINFLSLHVKCPFCNKSLMDNEQKIDNEPSIKLMIEMRAKKGYLRLSSIYGSYNYLVDIDIEDKEIARFYCPFCKEELITNEYCNTCSAPLAMIVLDMGGKISFCTRKGCQNHNIGFEDLTVALKKLYQEYGYRGKYHADEYIAPVKEHVHENSEEEEHKEIIASGTFLNSYCPFCKKSLIVDEMLKFKIININNEEGYIMLSPYLNVFSSKSTVYIPEEKNIQEVKCFHCDTSLIVKDSKCEKCGSTIVRISVIARIKMIDFYICSRKGCTWHGLSKFDLDEIRLEESLEW